MVLAYSCCGASPLGQSVATQVCNADETLELARPCRCTPTRTACRAVRNSFLTSPTYGPSSLQACCTFSFRSLQLATPLLRLHRSEICASLPSRATIEAYLVKYLQTDLHVRPQWPQGPTRHPLPLPPTTFTISCRVGSCISLLHLCHAESLYMKSIAISTCHSFTGGRDAFPWPAPSHGGCRWPV